MTFWQKFSEHLLQLSEKFKFVYLPQKRVDGGIEVFPITPGNFYCRLWLVELQLAKHVDWYTKRYPMFYAATRFTYGNEVLTIPYLAGLEYFKELAVKDTCSAIRCNIPLSPLFPYNKGSIELQAILYSLVADKTVETFGSVVGNFSQLLLVPELSKVVNIVEPTNSSIADLLSLKDTKIELGFQHEIDTNIGSDDKNLYPGYFAVIYDSEVDSEALCVVNDSLQVAIDDSFKVRREINGSYMLFRLEAAKEQDWNALTLINSLFQAASKAIVRGEFEKVKQYFRPVTVGTVLQSNDLTLTDRLRMARAISESIHEQLEIFENPNFEAPGEYEVGAPSLLEAKQEQAPIPQQAKSKTDPQEAVSKVETGLSLASIMRRTFKSSAQTIAQIASVERFFVK